MDLTAGEKERGTMETLLCSPVHRVQHRAGQIPDGADRFRLHHGALACCVSAPAEHLHRRRGQSARRRQHGSFPVIDPAGVFGVFAMVAPVALFFAALLLTIALFAKSYKEAQSYVSPLIVVVIMPAVIGMLPGIELTAKTALVPILNLSLVVQGNALRRLALELSSR